MSKLMQFESKSMFLLKAKRRITMAHFARHSKILDKPTIACINTDSDKTWTAKLCTNGFKPSH